MRVLKLALLPTVAAVLLAAAPVAASAAPILLYNTGVNNDGSVRSNTAAELHYTLASLPGGVMPMPIRVANSANGFPIPPWVGDNTKSAWVGPTTSDLSGPAGTYDYRVTFDLTGLVASTASITGQWATDDNGLDILINGKSTGSTANGFTSFTAFSITSGFISGINTLDFQVSNGQGPTGLRVEMTGTASLVPEPASFALLGAGLLALGLKRRKHG